MTPAEAGRFGSRLPPLIRGLFFERWDPSTKPVEIHHRSQLLALVGAKYAPRSDLPTDEIAAAFLAVLHRQLGAAELAEVVAKLPGLILDVPWPRVASSARPRSFSPPGLTT